MNDSRLSQHITVTDPKKVAWQQPLFKLPSPSRAEKLQHLVNYVSELSAVTDGTRDDLLALIERGQTSEMQKADKFPYTAIDLEDRLFVASQSKTQPEFVEEFLLNGVAEKVEQELEIRSKKWEAGLDRYERHREKLIKTVSRLRFFSWTYGFSAIALFIILLYSFRVIG
jgi:hypothetical protein